jgi:hypothetical protein
MRRDEGVDVLRLFNGGDLGSRARLVKKPSALFERPKPYGILNGPLT